MLRSQLRHISLLVDDQVEILNTDSVLQSAALRMSLLFTSDTAAAEADAFLKNEL